MYSLKNKISGVGERLMMSKSKRGVNEKILEYIYMEKEEFLDIYQKQPEAFEVFKTANKFE